jgi:hypothetical protein
LKGFEVETTDGTNFNGNPVIKESSSGNFLIVEVSKLSLPIGKEFKLQLNF